MELYASCQSLSQKSLGVGGSSPDLPGAKTHHP